MKFCVATRARIVRILDTWYLSYLWLHSLSCSSCWIKISVYTDRSKLILVVITTWRKQWLNALITTKRYEEENEHESPSHGARSMYTFYRLNLHILNDNLFADKDRGADSHQHGPGGPCQVKETFQRVSPVGISQCSHLQVSIIPAPGRNQLNFECRHHFYIQLARDGDTVRFSEHLAQFSDSKHDLNLLDEKKNSPLHYAARYSNLAIVKTLLENELVVVDNVGSDQMTPLHYAAR